MNILIVYASQTGTSQQLAQRLGCRLHQNTSDVVDIRVESIEGIQLPHLLFLLHSASLQQLLFLVSTTGQGAVPSSMQALWHALLDSSLPSGSDPCAKVGIFGVGDSSYECFNFAARKLHRRLQQLGIQSSLTLGDEQHPLGLFTEFDPWTLHILDQLPEYRAMRPIDPSLYNVQFSVDTESLVRVSRGRFEGTVVLNERLTPMDHFQDTRLLQIHTDFDASTLFRPGQVAVIYAQNCRLHVEEILAYTQWDQHQVICVGQKYGFAPITAMTQTVAWFLQHYVDLTSPPPQAIFSTLASLCTRADQQARLMEISTSDGYDLWLAYVHRPRRRPIEVLRDFDLQSLPLSLLFDLLVPMKPRSFSLAGIFPDHLDLCIGLVEYQSPLLQRGVYPSRVGLFSQFVKELSMPLRLSFDIVDSDIGLGEDGRPLLLIGAGTGIAPLRCVLMSPAHEHRQCFLFYGCRDADKDFYFQDELRALPNLTIQVAESRKAPTKMYVQERIRQHANLVHDLIVNQECIMLLSGNTKLPAAVKAALSQSLLAADGSLFVSQAEAELYLQALIKQRRFQIECW
jgi:sulfite reductase alpha subunit-like flavoprotein